MKTKSLITGALMSALSLSAVESTDRLLEQLQRLPATERSALLAKLAAADAPAAKTPAAATPAPVAAEPAEMTLTLDMFTVNTASRKAELPRDAASNISVVSRAQLDEWGVRDLNDVMRRIAGYTVVTDRDEVVYAARGNVSDNNAKYLVLIDGHAINSSENFGPGNVLQGPNDLSNVKQIEIIKGPGSVVWGAGALAGVINLRTLDAADLNGMSRSSLTYGADRTIVANFQTGLKLSDSASVIVMGAIATSDGQPLEATASTGFPIRNTRTVPAGYPVKFDTVYDRFEPSYFFQAKAKVGDFRLNSWTMFSKTWNRQFETGYGRENWLTNQKYFVEGSYETELSPTTSWGWKISTHHNHAEYLPGKYDSATVKQFTGGVDKFPSDISWVDNRINANAFVSHHFSESLSVDGGLDLTLGRNGPNHRINNFDPNNPGSTTGPVGFFLDNYTEETAIGGYVLGNYDVTKEIRVVAGAWIDQNKDRGNDPLNISPRLGAIWKASHDTTFKLLFNQAFLRPANFQTVNNKVIESETMQQFDFIWMQDFGKVTLTANAYAQKLDGFINIVSFGTATRFENSGVYKSKGLEVDFRGRVTRSITLWGNAAYAKAEAGSFPATLGLDSRRVLPDGSLLSYPKVTGNLGGTFKFLDDVVFISPAIRYQGRVDYRENAPKLVTLADAEYRQTKPFTYLDFNIGWEPSNRYGVYLYIANATDITDPTYQSVWNGYVTQPGRYFELSARYKW